MMMVVVTLILAAAVMRSNQRGDRGASGYKDNYDKDDGGGMVARNREEYIVGVMLIFL